MNFTISVNFSAISQLGEYQEEQEKLRDEILRADKNISYEQLNALPYLDQCVNGMCVSL